MKPPITYSNAYRQKLQPFGTKAILQLQAQLKAWKAHLIIKKTYAKACIVGPTAAPHHNP